jgi:hypothetical protein
MRDERVRDLDQVAVGVEEVDRQQRPLRAGALDGAFEDRDAFAGRDAR